MKFSAYLTALPYGTAAGEPCVEINTDVPRSHAEARALLAQLQGAMAGLRGVASFWFPSAPWGHQGCDAGLLPLIEDIATVRATIDVFSTAPTSLVVTQIVDATKLLAQPVEPAGLRMQLAARMHVPRAEEVVLQVAHEQNLTAAHLDVVSEFLSAAGVEPVGYLYVGPQKLESAVTAAAKAGSAWRVGSSAPQWPRTLLMEAHLQ